MSLSKTSFGEVVKRQYHFKLKAYKGMFHSLVLLQILAIFFSFSGVGSVGTGGPRYNVQINYYSADTVIALTMLWAFINAILLTTKTYREEDFVFVTNRMSENVANIFFLATASVIGGITAILSGYLLKVILHFGFQFKATLALGSTVGTLEYVYGVLATILFIFLFGSLGYLTGTIVQLHRSLIVLLPVAFIGLLTLSGIQEKFFLVWIGDFYFQEHSFLLFLTKAIGTTVILFGLATLIGNQREVGK